MAATAALLLSGCNNNIQIHPGQAYFKSFTYSGNDPYFDTDKLQEGTVFNPILQGSYSDASICRKGDDFYMVTSNYTFFPGLPVLHSKDLVNWEQICYALPTDQQLQNSSLKAEHGLFSSTIRYNEHDNKFYISSTLVGGGGHFVIKADNPAGPWSDPEWLFGVGGVHPALFFDTDGKAYILNQGRPNYDPPYPNYMAIWIQEFDPVNIKTKGERKIIMAGGDILEKQPNWMETPKLHKIGKYYILLASEGGSLGNGFASCAYRSENIWGPYEHYQQNPILTQRRLSPGRENAITSTAHVDLVDSPDGKWFAVFQGIRPYNEKNDYLQGRETFIRPVQWDNDWPYVIRNGESITSTVEAPMGVGYKTDAAVFNKLIPHGNFTYVENFESDSMPLQWEYLRTPSSAPFIPNGGKGLVLPLAPNNLRSQRHTGFVALRVMHNNFSSETEMHFLPENKTDFSGLAMYVDDSHNYIFGVTMDEASDMPILQLAKAYKNEDKEIVKAEIEKHPLGSDFKGRIFLRIERKEDGFVFLNKFKEDAQYDTLASQVPISYISPNAIMHEEGNRFYGVVVGPYASSEEY